jgi:hypothetical protein
MRIKPAGNISVLLLTISLFASSHLQVRSTVARKLQYRELLHDGQVLAMGSGETLTPV